MRGKMAPGAWQEDPAGPGPRGRPDGSGRLRRAQNDCRRLPESPRVPSGRRCQKSKLSLGRASLQKPRGAGPEGFQRAQRGPPGELGRLQNHSGRPQGVPERQEAPQRARPSSGGVLRLSSAFFPRLRLQVSEGSPRVFKEQPWENRGKTLGRPLENPCNA